MKRVYIIVLVMTAGVFQSCEEWLTVEPKDMVTVDKALTTFEGYNSAMAGVYQILQKAYNPGGFLIGSGTDVFANIYQQPTYGFSPGLNSAFNYDFSNTYFDSASGAVFLQLYQAIANLNIVIEKVETASELSTVEKNFIKGEAKALRAFLHFDLWRIYGTAPAAENMNSSNLILPYAVKADSNLKQYLSFADYFSNMRSDLSDAKDLLRASDPILAYSNAQLNIAGSLPEYKFVGWYNRQNRFNYFAATGLLARVELWLGNKNEAYAYALEVINARNSDGSLKFRLGTTADMGGTDKSLSVEQLFAVENLAYDDTSYSTYNAPCVASLTVINQIYPSSSDIRKRNLFSTLTSNALVYNAQISLKYSLMSENDNSLFKDFPILRLSEMYLIAIESAPSISDSQTFYNTFVNSRFDQAVTLTAANMQASVLNQYIREFWAEGQIFYAYKRLNLGSLPISNRVMTTNLYQVGLPSGETNGGDL